VGRGVGIGNHRPDVVPDDAHLFGKTKPDKQVVDVRSQAGFRVAIGGGVRATRAAQVRRDHGEVLGHRR
jgi:hypothetical protein